MFTGSHGFDPVGNQCCGTVVMKKACEVQAEMVAAQLHQIHRSSWYAQLISTNQLLSERDIWLQRRRLGM